MQNRIKEDSIRHLATLMASYFLLTGCADIHLNSRDLPYYISIHDVASSDPCVLSLRGVVDGVTANMVPLSGQGMIKQLQINFEKELHAQIPAGPCDGVSNLQQKFPLEKLGLRWLDAYAYEPADPDLTLERLEEYLTSMKQVGALAAAPIVADQDPGEYEGFEEADLKGSRWCGAPTDKGCPTQNHSSEGNWLYKVVQKCVVNACNELYAELSQRAKDITNTQNRDRRIIVLGYEIPWDKNRTLIRYGAAFYFDDGPLAQGGSRRTSFVGYDLIYANEASPQPFENHATAGQKQSVRKVSSWERFKRATGFPFAFVIGVKNAVFELTKMPFSFIGGFFSGRDNPFNYPLQNLLTARDALAVEIDLRKSSRLHAGWGLYRVLTEIPLVGQAFQYNFGSYKKEEDDEQSENVSRKLFLSRGIYGGTKWGQDTGLWAAQAHSNYPKYDVYSPPYRRGTVTDVVWSMFNLSHGPAYNEANYIIRHATSTDRLYLAGHSGGVQRSAAVSRILWQHGYSVVKVMGIAGPSIGQAFVDSRYPDAFTIYLNSQGGANQDVVSRVGVAAGAYSTVLDYAILTPLKYAAGFLFFPSDKLRDRIYREFDRVGFTNGRIIEVDRKLSSQHQTPLRASLANRVVFDAYIRSEFATTFREDLERPGIANKSRPDAFSWDE